MDSENFGMFCSELEGGSLGQKSMNTENAPWISQLKSAFAGTESIVKPYATKGQSFHAIGEDISEVARIYFVVNEKKYRIFGLAKGVGEIGRATFSHDALVEVINANPGRAFEITLQDNAIDIAPFIALVEANGAATDAEMDEFIKLRDGLLQKLGL